MTEDINCALCKAEVTSREHALMCDTCRRWHHQRCIKMPAAVYRTLSASDESWFCQHCIQLQPSTLPESTPEDPQSTNHEFRANLPDVEIQATLSQDDTTKVWGGIPYNEFLKKVGTIYDEIVFYRRNIFKTPSGKAGKDFVNELSFWLHQFNSSSKLNGVAMEVFMILPTLMLQKPSARSKAKEHSTALERRLKLWKAGEIDQIMKEIRFIQKSFKSSKKTRSPEDVARSFSKLIMEGKVSAALKLLDKESATGVLGLSDEVLDDLKKKHPEPAPIPY